MSADNKVLITTHPQGGYTLVEYFLSDDKGPSPRSDSPQYQTLVEALEAYTRIYENYPPEYGMGISLSAITKFKEEECKSLDTSLRVIRLLSPHA